MNLAELLDQSGEGSVIEHPVSRYVPEMQPGDTVLLWSSGAAAGIRAIGTVVGHEPGDEEAASVAVRIDSILEQPVLRERFMRDPVLSSAHIIQSPHGTSFRVGDEEWSAIQRLLDDVEDGPFGPGSELPNIADDTGIALAELERWLRGIERRGQAILYGPRGTGKTYVARRLAEHLAADGDGIVELVQFHPAYTYEDFIQGLRPVPTATGGLSYEIREGRFQSFARRAAARSGTSVLIVDEINRASLARVFGELMYLLEYRGETIPLATGGELAIPSNVRILATMNTADRSIALVDHALRRRFAFLPLRPQFGILRKYHAGRSGASLVEPLVSVLRRLHTAIGDPNLHLGISYFLVPDLERDLEDIWRTEIEPYLEELFFDHQDPLGEFNWSRVQVLLQTTA
jgi:5-methylcytosine-specific restriction enzyme B